MQALSSRKGKFIVILVIASIALLVSFHLYMSDVHEAVTSYASSIEKELHALGYGVNPPSQSQSTTIDPPSSDELIPENQKLPKLPTEAAAATAIVSSTPTPTVSNDQEAEDLKVETPKPLSIEVSSASPMPTPPTGAIVAAVSLEMDLKWISEFVAPMWKLHRYNFDDPSPPPETAFPMNKGNEAMMYLSYIINNYNTLPDYSIFIHGHRESWHQEGDMVNIINNVQLPALDEEGYAPLRCDWYPSCPKEIRPVHHDAVVWGPGVHREDTEHEIGRAWPTLFGDNVDLPQTIASQCCAQFIVTRQTIQQRSKADYERMRQWLIDTELITDVSGRVFEKLWAYIFTKEAIRCPPPQQCACKFFGQCQQRAWPIPPDGLQKWPEKYDNY